MLPASLLNAARALRGLACLSLFAAALPLAGCVGESTDDISDDDSLDDALTNPRYGVDYSWARPKPSDLYAQGYTFAARYLSYDTSGKNLTAAEANSLTQAGIDIVANWEAGADDALGGYNARVQHAHAAYPIVFAFSCSSTQITRGPGPRGPAAGSTAWDPPPAAPEARSTWPARRRSRRAWARHAGSTLGSP